MTRARIAAPVWARPLTQAKLAARLAAEPDRLPELPAPLHALRGCRLLVLSDVARTSLHTADDFFALAASVCALGAFDGVHLGHRALIAACVAEARECGLPSVAVTFDPDPADVLVGPSRGSTLLDVPDRLRLLASLGLDALLVVPFTPAFAATSSEVFLLDWLIPCVGACSLHVGADFCMGAGGTGSVEALVPLALQANIVVHKHGLVERAGAVVSATRIRSLVRAGEVESAARLLERDHRVCGTVVHGRGEGTSLGFPTADLACETSACLPAEGVYAGLACVGVHAWPAAINVGAPRTFGGKSGAAFLEATLLGYSGDLYGSALAVCFVARLREMRTFASLDELTRTIHTDVAWVRRNLGSGEIVDGYRGGVVHDH